MRKKRLNHLALLSTLLMILSCFTGCGSTSTTNSSTASAETTQGITVEYSSEDMDDSWDASKATKIILNGSSITVDGSGASAQGSIVSITKAGTYVLSGKLTDGQIIVQAGEKDTVKLVLNGASIACSDNAPIYSQQSKKTIVTLAKGTENTVQDGTKYTYAAGEDEPDAAIFSKGDLTINGTGALTVKANADNGIGTKDDLVITGGKLSVTAANDGLRGRDSIAINGGTFTINSSGDGLQSNNDADADKGWISLDGGNFTITSAKDGIQAETLLQITDGKFNLTTGGGSAQATTSSNSNGFPGPGRQNTAATEEETDSTKGIKASTNILISGGTFDIDACDDAIHANGNVAISGGTLSISTGDDAVHGDGNVAIDNGSITIAKSYEGLEGVTVTINGGEIRLNASDDGINSAGGSDDAQQEQDNFRASDENKVQITGGYIYINAAGDGIDSNGDLYFKGGTVIVNGPTNNGNGALDYNGTSEISGGTLIATGSSGMAQAPGSSSTQNSLMIRYTTVQKAGTLVNLVNEAGNTVLTFAPAKDYQSIVISMPELEKGKTYTLKTGGTCSSQLTDGLSTKGTCSGNKELTDVNISDTVTSIADDGSAVSGGMGGGMGGQGGPGGAQPPGGKQRPGTRQ